MGTLQFIKVYFVNQDSLHQFKVSGFMVAQIFDGETKSTIMLIVNNHIQGGLQTFQAVANPLMQSVGMKAAKYTELVTISVHCGFSCCESGGALF